jgi:hypothetical protein
MYAIYEQEGGANLSLFEDEDELVDLNEAEEILRQLKKDDPSEFERIAGLSTRTQEYLREEKWGFHKKAIWDWLEQTRS